MADRRFFDPSGPFRLADLATMVVARLHNSSDGARLIFDVMPLEQAGPTHLSFMENRRYSDVLAESKAGACLITEQLADRAPSAMTLLLTDRPRRCFARIAQLFYPEKQFGPAVHARAAIAPSARIGNGCRIEAGVVIGENAEIGESCWLGPNCVVCDGVRIGTATKIGANASVSHCDIGARCVIYPGAQIGQPGFGFESDAAGLIKMPQIGRVIIGADVEIGANTTIDRGSGPDTVIGQGTMIDNLVQIGHNVEIGKNCVIVSGVGIAGSTKIGDHVVIAGKVGIVGHITIGNRVRIAAMSGVARSIPDDSTVGGAPAVPIKDFRRQVAAVKRLGRRGEDRN